MGSAPGTPVASKLTPRTARPEQNGRDWMTKDQLKPGDTVIVTGAAQGIGRAIALRLAKAGARLALWDIAAGGLSETAERCRALGVEAKVYSVDVGDRGAIESAGKAVIDNLGAPFGLVNNAAIFPRSFILDMDPEEWDRVLRVNLTGPFLAARTVGQAMVAAGRGAIVNIGSTVALRGDPDGAHYASAKAGILALTKSLALALGPHNIRVNCVMPGISDTAQPLGGMSRDELLARGKQIPLGRIGQAEDTAGLVAFLLGDEASYITGQSIAVNGGAMSIP
jgi:NAD(P)-dependent dehydrogenase (short-subunit alcohol dehydrogenase family)